jgi:hypothetical protein
MDQHLHLIDALSQHERGCLLHVKSILGGKRLNREVAGYAEV